MSEYRERAREAVKDAEWEWANAIHKRGIDDVEATEPLEARIDAALGRLVSLVEAEMSVAALRSAWECSCPFGGRRVRNFRLCLRCKAVDKAEAIVQAAQAAIDAAAKEGA